MFCFIVFYWLTLEAPNIVIYIFRILNSIFKNGARLSNTFGTLSVYYSIFGIILEKTRGCEDELNTIVAGTSTGLLFKATS